ncbi:MAG: rhomboid family intramembrane serine protease [Thermoguttaceae bacterium]|jgi:membrane associated rhomboid family serine protease|nr:rhomboid family intramembrane serine protease [Thermoguttaceae bacterium]
MGVYDRDYYRGNAQPGIQMRAPQTAVVWIILINVGLWVVDAFVPQLALMKWLELRGDTLWKPWLWWNLVSYGFAHAAEPSHVLFNMLGLFILGRDIEWTYGKREFIRLYLALVMAGGLVWSLAMTARVFLFHEVPPEMAGRFSVVGASAAVSGIVVLFALHFPRRTLLLFFLFPIPAWVLGVLLVTFDIIGVLGEGKQNVAYIAHLAGAGFAFLYFKTGWRFGRLGEGFGAWLRRLRGPQLRVRRPEDDSEESLSDEVDRILEKISREGEASLTRRERRALQDASRRYQQRRGQ